MFVIAAIQRSVLHRWWRAATAEEVIYGNSGNGNKEKPKGPAWALYTLRRVPLDVTGDILW